MGLWSETYVLAVELRLANTPSERVSLQLADREWRRSVGAMCAMRWVGVVALKLIYVSLNDSREDMWMTMAQDDGCRVEACERG